MPALHRKHLVLEPGNESGARGGAPGRSPAEGSPDAEGAGGEGGGGPPPSCVDVHQQLRSLIRFISGFTQGKRTSASAMSSRLGPYGLGVPSLSLVS